MDLSKKIAELALMDHGINDARLRMIISEFEKGIENTNSKLLDQQLEIALSKIHFFKINDVPVGKFVYLSDIKEMIGLNVSVQKLGIYLSSIGVEKVFYRFERDGKLKYVKSKKGYYVRD